jgi:Zn finger protein HypA/HybF involved in hydrogenase expression
MVNKEGEYKSPYNEVKPKKSERKCLKCNHSFKSDGPGNRICGECSRNNVHAYRKDPIKTFGTSLGNPIGD